MLAEASVSVSAGRRLRRRRRRQALSQNGYGHKNYQKRRTATDGPGREGRGTGARGPHTAPPRTGRKRERSRNKPALRGAGEREGPPRGHRKPEGTSLMGTGGEGGGPFRLRKPRENPQSPQVNEAATTRKARRHARRGISGRKPPLTRTGDPTYGLSHAGTTTDEPKQKRPKRRRVDPDDPGL